jgi:hypothetical protein
MSITSILGLRIRQKEEKKIILKCLKINATTKATKSGASGRGSTSNETQKKRVGAHIEHSAVDTFHPQKHKQYAGLIGRTLRS